MGARYLFAVLALSCLVLGGCAKSATPAGLEVILATNLRFPSEYDGITVTVSQGTGSDAWGSPVLEKSLPVTARTLPATVSIAPGKSADENVLIVVTATKGGSPVVVEARVTTVPLTRVAELVIVLSASCAYVACPSPSETCEPSTGKCGSVSVSSGSLPPYDPGDVDRVDAGSLDATIGDAPVGHPHPMDSGTKDSGTKDGGRDSSVPDGGAHDAPSESAAPDAGPCLVYYVSTAGSDSNTGCSPSSPLKTIVTATKRAAAAVTASAPTIEVCRGTYPETTLVISTPVNLLGGFDCSSWTRPADNGYGAFDGTNKTVIENNQVWTQAATLELTQGSGATVVSGFTIHAAATSSEPFVSAVTVASVSCIGQGTAPLLSSDVFAPDMAGTWPDTYAVTAAGVYVAEQATATVLNSSVSAGVSTSAGGTGSASSYGVYADPTSTVVLSGDTIAGGGGPTSSYGVYLANATADAGALAATIESSGIVGGSGNVSYGVWAYGRRALTLSSSEVELTPLATDGGPGSCGVGVLMDGVALSSSMSATITGNRIFATPCDHAGVSGYGLQLENLASARIYNNMISGAVMSHTASGSAALAVALTTVTSPDVRFNTLVGGVAVNGAASSGYSAALYLDGVTGAILSDNIFAGESYGDAGIAVSALCVTGQAPPIAAFENNVLFNSPLALLRYGCPGSYDKYTTMKQALAAIGLATDETGNLTFAASCDPDAGPCAANSACGDPEACLAQMFGGWSEAQDGLSSLESFVADAGCDATAGNGWTLSANAPCAVVHGGAADAGVAADIYGPSCRSAAVTSMGAAQGSACAP